MVWLLAAAAVYEVSRVLALEAVIGILQNKCKLIKLNFLNLIAVQAALKKLFLKQNVTKIQKL